MLEDVYITEYGIRNTEYGAKKMKMNENRKDRPNFTFLEVHRILGFDPSRPIPHCCIAHSRFGTNVGALTGAGAACRSLFDDDPWHK